jgi:hypothetical protein
MNNKQEKSKIEYNDKFILIVAQNAIDYKKTVLEGHLKNSFYWSKTGGREIIFGFAEGTNVIVTEFGRYRDDIDDVKSIIEYKKFKIIEGCL